MGQDCCSKVLVPVSHSDINGLGKLGLPLVLGILLILAGCSTSTSTPTSSPVASSSPTVSPTPTSPTVSTPTASPSPIATKPEAVKNFETRLSQAVAQVIGLPLQTIDCPATIELKANSRFECQGTSDGQVFAIAVSLTDDPAKFQWGTKGLLLLPKLEEFIQKRVKDKSGLDVKADCGGKLRVAKPGESFECKVTDARNQTRSAKVTVKDEQGSVDISLL